MQVLGWPMLRQKRYLRWRWTQSFDMTQGMKFIIKSWWVTKQCTCAFWDLIPSWISEALVAMASVMWTLKVPTKVVMWKDNDFSGFFFNESKTGMMSPERMESHWASHERKFQQFLFLHCHVTGCAYKENACPTIHLSHSLSVSNKGYRRKKMLSLKKKRKRVWGT